MHGHEYSRLLSQMRRNGSGICHPVPAAAKIVTPTYMLATNQTAKGGDAEQSGGKGDSDDQWILWRNLHGTG